MLRSTGARRYAQALLEIARERGFGAAQLDAWAAQLRGMADLIGSPDLAPTLRDPSTPAARKRQIVRGALAQAVPGLDPTLANLAELLIDRERTALMPGIADQFATALNEMRGIVNAEVTSAVPLTEEQQRRLGDELGRATQRQIALRTRVDPAILGGLIVRVGDQLIDASVAGRLSALRRQLV